VKKLVIGLAISGLSLTACGGSGNSSSSGATGNAAVCALARKLVGGNLTNAQFSALTQKLANVGPVGDAQLSADLGSLSSDWSNSDHDNPSAKLGQAVTQDVSNVLQDCVSLGYLARA
jgi:hypothetical protein